MFFRVEKSGAHPRDVEKHRHPDLDHALENALFLFMGVVCVKLSSVSRVHQRMHEDHEMHANDSDPVSVVHPLFFNEVFASCPSLLRRGADTLVILRF